MSRLPVETPDVTVKTVNISSDCAAPPPYSYSWDKLVVQFQGRMVSCWSLRTKTGLLLLALALYVYVLVFAKTMYLKSQRLDRIADMAIETEKMMRHVREIDRNFVLKMEYLDDLQGDSSY